MKRIVVCLPGNTFSSRFLYSLNELIKFFLGNNIFYILSLATDNNIYYVRNRCLGGNVLRGKKQKPFQGEVDYTHLLWIDSDIIFKPSDFETLLKKDKNIIAGYYSLEDMVHSSVIQEVKNGYQNFTKMKDLLSMIDPIPVDLSGMGFMLVKRGVFEKLTYPWFNPVLVEDGNLCDFCGDDASFCKRVIDMGETVWVDPTVRVGHMKRVAL
jgi:hypothetical protein